MPSHPAAGIEVMKCVAVPRIWHRDCVSGNCLPRARQELTVMKMNGRTTVDAPMRRGMLPEMAELSLLLPTWQMQKLADLAQAQGVSVGKYLRDLITNTVPMPNATNN